MWSVVRTHAGNMLTACSITVSPRRGSAPTRRPAPHLSRRGLYQVYTPLRSRAQRRTACNAAAVAVRGVRLFGEEQLLLLLGDGFEVGCEIGFERIERGRNLWRQRLLLAAQDHGALQPLLARNKKVFR